MNMIKILVLGLLAVAALSGCGKDPAPQPIQPPPVGSQPPRQLPPGYGPQGQLPPGTQPGMQPPQGYPQANNYPGQEYPQQYPQGGYDDSCGCDYGYCCGGGWDDEFYGDDWGFWFSQERRS